MYKKMKEADGAGPSRRQTDTKDEKMDFKKIMKDIELFSMFRFSLIFVALLVPKLHLLTSPFNLLHKFYMEFLFFYNLFVA